MPRRQVVVFTLGSDAFAFDIHWVREIIVMQEITQIPNAPEHVEGVIELRGQVIPVIDLPRRLGKRRRHTQQDRILVLVFDGWEVGLLVDEVADVSFVNSDMVESPSEGVPPACAPYIEGAFRGEAGPVYLLDAAKAISGMQG